MDQFGNMLSTRIAEVNGDVVSKRKNLSEKLDSVNKCRAYLKEAKYSDISVSSVDMSYFHPNIESYWQEMSASVEGISLRQLTPEQQKAVRDHHLDDINKLMTNEGIKFHAPVIISSAHKPAI
jgi:hypothetical protein